MNWDCFDSVCRRYPESRGRICMQVWIYDEWNLKLDLANYNIYGIICLLIKYSVEVYVEGLLLLNNWNVKTRIINLPIMGLDI